MNVSIAAILVKNLFLIIGSEHGFLNDTSEEDYSHYMI